MSIQPIPCEQCGAATPPHEVVSYGNGDGTYRQWCSTCVNLDVAGRMGVDGFDQAHFTPVCITDARGVEHEFHFHLRLFGKLALDAFELVDGSPGGYQFQIIADAEVDPWSLLARLIERIRRALAVTHLSPQGNSLGISDSTVRGRIESNSSTSQPLPVLVIDGCEVSWEAFGRMLTSFEGWQFKLSIVDRSEEP